MFDDFDDVPMGLDDDKVARRADAFANLMRAVAEQDDPKIKKLGMQMLEKVLKTIDTNERTNTVVVFDGGKGDKREEKKSP